MRGENLDLLFFFLSLTIHMNWYYI